MMACEVEPSCVSTTPLPALTVHTHTRTHTHTQHPSTIHPDDASFLHLPVRAQIGYHDGPWCSVYGPGPELWNTSHPSFGTNIPAGQTNNWGGSSYPDDTGDIVHAIDSTSRTSSTSVSLRAVSPHLCPAHALCHPETRRSMCALLPRHDTTRRRGQVAHHNARGMLDGCRARPWQPLPLRGFRRLPRQRRQERLCQ